MKDVNGYTIAVGQRIYVRARPCGMAPSAGPEALDGYPAIVIALDELFETVEVLELYSCNQRTARPWYTSVQEGVDKVEAARRQARGEESMAKNLDPSHKHFELYYKWQQDMFPRKRGFAKTEIAKK